MINYKVAVVGDWHLAFVTATVLSHVGHRVALVHPNLSKVELENGFPKPPVTEPGLPEMIQGCRTADRLDAKNSYQGWTAESIWLAIDTPVNDQDEPNVEPLIEAVSEIAKYHPKIKALMISSQIPMGFSRELERRFQLPVVYIPENLRLGKGIETFLKADRTVIGADAEVHRSYAKDLLREFSTEFLLCGLETSEMTKHATNAFLATSISFANELARIGEQYGVESQIVAKALKMDKRIGPAAYVAPGLGFAGGTLPRDLRVLQRMGKEHSLPTPLLNAVLKVNEETTNAVADIVLNRARSLQHKPRVLILGYTYKADIDTLRRSLSVDVAKRLQAEQCEVWGYDPVMNQRDLTSLKNVIRHCPTLEECAVKPDVILVMTARPIFKSIEWKSLKGEKPGLVLDTQNLLSAEQVLSSGLDFKPLWSPLVQAK